MDIEKILTPDGILTPNKVCQILNNGLVKDYPKITKHDKVFGGKITNGTITKHSTTLTYNAVTDIAIDQTHVLHVYTDVQTTKTYAVIMTISGDVVTVGTPVQLPKYMTQLVLYEVASGKYALIGHYSNTTHMVTINVDLSTYAISVINETQLVSVTTTLITKNALCKISTYDFVVSCGNNYGTIIYFTYNSTFTSVTINTTLAIETDVTLNQGNCFHMGNGVVLLVYVGWYNSTYYLTYKLYAISGGAMTVKKARVYLGNTTYGFNNLQMVMVGSNIFFTYITNTYMSVTGGLLKYDGDVTCTITSKTLFWYSSPSNVVNWMEVQKLNERTLFVLAGFYANSVKACTITITGDLMQVNSLTNVLAYQFAYYSLARCKYDSGKLLMSGIDGSALMYYGVLNIDEILQNETRDGKPIGIAKDSSGSVFIKGIYKGLSGLTIGANYYYDVNGVISMDNTGIYLGFAIAENKLYIHGLLT